MAFSRFSDPPGRCQVEAGLRLKKDREGAQRVLNYGPCAGKLRAVELCATGFGSRFFSNQLAEVGQSPNTS